MGEEVISGWLPVKGARGNEEDSDKAADNYCEDRQLILLHAHT